MIRNQPCSMTVLSNMRPALARWVESSLSDAVAGAEPLLAEASHRRFYRLRLARAGDSGAESGDASLVVMDSPPALERNDAFLYMQGLLARHGLPVPRILASDADQGFFLLSDFGNRHLQDAYRGPERERAIALAIDALVRMQAIEDAAVPPYEESRLRDELGIFGEWLLGALLGEALPAHAQVAFDALVENALRQPQCLIHRDYHCRNLMLTPEGCLGIVDFQDALIGPATYDLACLLWDCYHRFDGRELRRWQERYRTRCRFGFDREALSRTLDLTGLQRQLKAAGIFVRLLLRDGKSSHLRHIPPVFDAMRQICAAYPETTALGKWLAQIQAQTAAALKTRGSVIP